MVIDVTELKVSPIRAEAKVFTAHSDRGAFWENEHGEIRVIDILKC